MADVVAFKSGKDLGEETRVEDADTVCCVDCGSVESDEQAYENGWQLEPPVCPDCLRWTFIGAEADCCSGRPA